MCHARDAILVCLDHRIPVLWKRDVSTLGLYLILNYHYEFEESFFHQNSLNLFEESFFHQNSLNLPHGYVFVYSYM